MKAAPFEYVRAGSIDEACEVLQREGDAVKVIAGGQSLMPMMAMRLVRPGWLLDINEIAALKFIAIGQGCRAHRRLHAAIGGRARRRRLPRACLCCDRRSPGWAMSRPATAAPSAEASRTPTPAPNCRSWPRCWAPGWYCAARPAARTVQADAFFSGPMMTATDPNECLEEVHWPVWGERRTGSAFTEISNRHGDFAMVSAAAQLALDDDGRCVRAAFGLGGVGQTPLAFPRLAQRLVGTRLEDEVVKSVAHDAAAESDPGSDLFATAAYRRHLASVLAARVLGPHTSRRGARQ